MKLLPLLTRQDKGLSSQANYLHFPPTCSMFKKDIKQAISWLQSSIKSLLNKNKSILQPFNDKSAVGRRYESEVDGSGHRISVQ